MSETLSEIINIHAEESAFLWLLRDAAAEAPHYNLEELKDLEDRIEAHLDGLRIAKDSGWEFVEQALDHKEPGEVFVATVLAFESNDKQRLSKTFEAAFANEDTLRGLSSALGWLPHDQIRRWSERFLQNSQALYRFYGLIACSMHRQDIGQLLDRLINDTDPSVQCRAIRLAGEMKRQDLLHLIRPHLNSSDEETRFWASWTLSLLGHAAGPVACCQFIYSKSPFLRRALNIGIRGLAHDKAIGLIRSLSADAQMQRAVTQSTGIIGDPISIPWLLQKMQQPELARLAGESFTFITGADLAELDLEGEWPEGFETGPNEDPEDDDVELDPDEDLAWPDVDKVSAWWSNHQSLFQNGQRYLLGKPISIDHCREVLRNGYQRQRQAAAIELALAKSDEILFETRAPGLRQKQLLQIQ